MSSGFKKVGVVGLGQMGSGIAQVAASSGFPTVAMDITEDRVRLGRSRIGESLERLARAYESTGGRKGISPVEKDAVLGRLTESLRLQELLGADIVIEAVTENTDQKLKLIAELAELGYDRFLVSNTSSIPITRLASAYPYPDRFMGMHFMNPVPVQRGCELVRGFGTSDETVRVITEFCRELNKEPIFAEDGPGFGINRMLVPFLIEAVKVVEQGIMSCEDADKMTLCAGHAMGPITTLDYVGLDTTLAISGVLQEELGDAYRPPNLLKQLVRSGCLGLKNGRGFYIWEDGKKAGANPFVKRYRRT